MKTLVITGASKGIGLAVAGLCLDEGYRVINLSRSPAPDARIDNLAIDLASPQAEIELAELLKVYGVRDDDATFLVDTSVDEVVAYGGRYANECTYATADQDA